MWQQINLFRNTRVAKLRMVAGSRRGVVSVLAMMFLILFSSLSVAMAIASQGNLRTASTNLYVMSAMGAAETGLAVGEVRLAYAASRILNNKGNVDATVGAALWGGSPSAVATTTIVPMFDGTSPSNVSDALMYMHGLDNNTITIGGVTTPQRGNIPSGLSSGTYGATDWIVTPAISLVDEVGSTQTNGSAFQITYAPLADGKTIRIVSTGYDFGVTRNGLPVSRTMTKDFTFLKAISSAIVSPTRVMVGKNVMIDGNIATTFEDVGATNGDPVLVRSDFQYLNAALDQDLVWLTENLKSHDVDGDNRLRVNHPEEGLGLGVDIDDPPDGIVDKSFVDKTGDGYVDDFDLFLTVFDTNEDGMVALSDELRAGGPYEALTAELVDGGGDPLDEDLSLLIDSANPDRNKNRVYGYADLNNNGRFDPDSETLEDYDAIKDVYPDHVLGYRDGVLDVRDLYAKINGSVQLRVTESEWTSAQGDLHDIMHGSIRPKGDNTPLQFALPEQKLVELTASDFNVAQTELVTAVSNGADFWEQVATNLGTSVASLAAYVETGAAGTPRYYRVDPDSNSDNLPDNWSTAYFEKMPFNAPAYSDWYYRPVFENMVFRDVEIPMGVNGLFNDCTFVGVCYVRSHTDNTHAVWNLYGRLTLDSTSGRPKPPDRMLIVNPADYPDDILPASALPPNQLMSVPVDGFSNALDKADFAKTGRPLNWVDLPEPLVISGTRVINTKAYSNNIRFHDCLFIGSIVSDASTTYTHPRNKMQFTGGTKFVPKHPDSALASNPTYIPDTADLAAIARSSMMLPNYSVDIGSFNSPPTQDVRLKGAIIAGILDIRGNASIDGALLMTYKPVVGEGPLRDPLGNPIGNPAGFNTTLGYFGPDDGDLESLDPQDLTEYNGVKITGWDTNGDGLPDIPHDEVPTAAQLAAGATPIPFYGYGSVQIKFNPSMELPDGIMLPISIGSMATSYREGKLQ